MKKLLSGIVRIFFCACIYFSDLNAADHKRSRHQDYYKMFLDRDLTDFAIVSEEGSTFPCHKMVLFAANKYWRALFNGENCKECHEGKIYLPYSDRVIQIILERTYIPDQELFIGIIEFSDYLALFDFANLSFDRSLIDILATADIKFENNILYALEATIINKDGHLGYLVFKYVRDMPIDEEICNYLIEMLECNNEIIIHLMRRIRTSTLIKYLAENNRDLLIAHNILKDNKYILNMTKWSWEEIENERGEYNYKNTLNELMQNLQSNLLSRVEELQIGTAEQVFSFLLAYFNVNILSASKAVFHASTVNANGLYALDFSKISSKSLVEIAGEDAHWVNNSWRYNGENEHRVIFQNAFNVVMESTNRARGHIVCNLKIKDRTIKFNESRNLAQLFALAYIAEPEFQNIYFQDAYNEILHNLMPGPSYVKIINRLTSFLLRNNRKENPFIKSFNEIMKVMIERLDDI